MAATDYALFAMDAFTFGGDQVCMPQNVSGLVVYYNVDLFNANEVALPKTGWTWDEFVDAAETLTQDTDGDGQTDLYGVAVEPVMYRMVSCVWSAGGDVVDDVDHPTRLTLNTPEALGGLEKFISLGANGHNIVPPEAEVAAEDDGTRFMRGGAATVLHSDAFCMAAAAEDHDAVWSFVEYAVGKEGQRILAETGRIVPERRQAIARRVPGGVRPRQNLVDCSRAR